MKQRIYSVTQIIRHNLFKHFFGGILISSKMVIIYSQLNRAINDICSCGAVEFFLLYSHILFTSGRDVSSEGAKILAPILFLFIVQFVMLI